MTPTTDPMRRVLAALALTVSLAASAMAQPARTADARNPGPTAPGMTGMTPEEVRARLRAAGVPESAIESAVAMPPAPGPRMPVPAAEPPIVPDSLAAVPLAPAPHAGPEPLGFEIFRWAPTTFEPLSHGPVGEDYPLGPGDELTLTLWGDDQLALTVVVSREGHLTLPDIGQVSVSGLTLEAARTRVRAALARVYSGLRGNSGRATTHLSLSLGRLRSIQVFLLGDVVRPGGYTLSSVARMLNALYAAGGPTTRGSLRDVRLMRGGRVATSVDLYDVVLRGAGSEMPRLENGDVVFVPPAGRRVTLSGPARRTGIVELRAGEHLRDLMAIVGGPLPEADLSRAQVDRIVPVAERTERRGQGRVALDVALGAVLAEGGTDVELMDRDSLTLFALPDRRTNTVQITGRGVVRPGVYQFHEGMRASDLIALAGGVTPDAFLERAQIVRTLPDSTRASLRFVPSRALAGEPAEDPELHALDDVSIRSSWDLRDRQHVFVHGLVRDPGRFELLDHMTLTDVLMRAGGLQDAAWSVRAEVVRIAEGARLADTLVVPIARELARSAEASAFLLRPFDAVFIRRDPNFREPELVMLAGEVKFPGAYALLRRDERLSELVARAGGVTPEAYVDGARFLRQGGSRLAIDLARALDRTRSASNLVMQPGDTLHVPRYSPTVSVEGAVFNPVSALYTPGAGVGFYVTQASGYRRDADRRAVVVVSPSGKVRRGGSPEPGSRIIVPARPPETPRDGLKDFATLMSVLASAATTVFLVTQSGR